MNLKCDLSKMQLSVKRRIKQLRLAIIKRNNKRRRTIEIVTQAMNKSMRERDREMEGERKIEITFSLTMSCKP